MGKTKLKFISDNILASDTKEEIKAKMKKYYKYLDKEAKE